VRLLLLEDEADLGAAIVKALTAQAYVVDWVQSGATAWDLLDRDARSDAAYRLCILDWLVPELSGVDLCRRLRDRGIMLPILMLTARDAEADRVVGLDAGADDYLVKPFGMAELLARLRALQRRSPDWQPPRLQVETLGLDRQTYEAIGSAGRVELNSKEFQLLELFLRHPGQVLTRDRIFDGLWSIDETPGSNVVSVQIRRLRRKLASIGEGDAIATVYGVGYRLQNAATTAAEPLEA
jgi:DNA-binding response OmpR family regulator